MKAHAEKTWFDTFFHWVTPVLLGVLAALLVLIFSGYCYAETETPVVTRPHIVHVRVTQNDLYGLAEVPDDGEYYAAITYFLQDSEYMIIVVNVDESGEFRLVFGAAIAAVEIVLTDTPDVFEPGTYTEFDSLWIQMV